MKQLLMLILLFLSVAAYSQTDSSWARMRVRDSLVLGLTNQMNVSYERIQKVFSTLEQSRSKMTLNSRDPQLTGQERNSRFHQLAAERDSLLGRLLMPAQIVQLKTFVSAHRL